MALKVTAIQSPSNSEHIGLLFTQILGEPVRLDDIECAVEVGRKDWENKAGKEWLSIVDNFYSNARLPEKMSSLHYTKSYVCVRKDEVNVVFFYQLQKGVKAWVKLSAAPGLRAALESKGIDFKLTDAEEYVTVTVLPNNVEQVAAIVGERLKAAKADE